MDQIEAIVREVVSRLACGGGAADERLIPAEVSARHVHLSKEDLKALFGLDQLESTREISQPGQFLSGSRVRLIGPKGILDNVAVLGPTRSATQVEISAGDARALGVSAPVRLSGDLADAAVVTLQAGSTVITRKAAIVAKRHIHMTPADAAAFGVSDGQSVSVRILGTRPLVLEDCPIRVTNTSALALHMDTDEANAAGAGKDCKCRIVGACAPTCAPVLCTQPEAPASDAPRCSTLEDKLITEQVIRRQCAAGVKALLIAKGQIITPLAKDTAKALGMSITYGG